MIHVYCIEKNKENTYLLNAYKYRYLRIILEIMIETIYNGTI